MVSAYYGSVVTMAAWLLYGNKVKLIKCGIIDKFIYINNIIIIKCLEIN